MEKVLYLACLIIGQGLEAYTISLQILIKSFSINPKSMLEISMDFISLSHIYLFYSYHTAHTAIERRVKV